MKASITEVSGQEAPKPLPALILFGKQIQVEIVLLLLFAAVVFDFAAEVLRKELTT